MTHPSNLTSRAKNAQGGRDTSFSFVIHLQVHTHDFIRLSLINAESQYTDFTTAGLRTPCLHGNIDSKCSVHGAKDGKEGNLTGKMIPATFTQFITLYSPFLFIQRPIKMILSQEITMTPVLNTQSFTVETNSSF